MMRRTIAACALASLVLLLAPAGAEAGCGGAGEAPCRHWVCTTRLLGVCVSGYWVRDGVDGCDSDRLNNMLLFCAACGHDGLPACFNGPRCNAWHNVIAGFCAACGGDGQIACWSSPACRPGYVSIAGFCAYRGWSAEPGTDVSGTPLLQQAGSDRDPVRGVADLHGHQFSNLGFGGATFWGKPFDSRGINAALAWCDYTNDFGTTNVLLGTTPRVPFLGSEVHGPRVTQLLTSPSSVFTGEGLHEVGGTGPLDGWPKWSTTTHQQMYYKWLERAYLGGLRLQVMLAVSNEVLCRGGKVRNGFTCDDMSAIDRQLAAARQLEQYVDGLHGGPGRGWYRIAYSPGQARQIIRDGKLAIVLGIEVDSLFGCTLGQAPCTEAYVRGRLQHYYALGVRHVFPMHVFNNQFGGTAFYNDMFDAGNQIVTGQFFDARDCSSDGYSFRLAATVALDFFRALLGGASPAHALTGAHCNQRTLTNLGATLVTAMMDRKMIIDTDHMSRLMRDTVVSMAIARNYPLVAGHPALFDLESTKDEGQYKAEDLVTYRDLGGVVAVPVARGRCGTTADFRDKYRYVVGRMRGGQYDLDDDHPGVAFSTDFNGFVQQTGPRFGSDGCDGSEGPVVLYPFSGPLGGSFARQATGGRQFDFNTQGLAHVGLVPDFFRDLLNVGMTTAELDPLFNSAETYVRMWERIEGVADPAPTVAPIVTGDLGRDGWYTSEVTVAWEVIPATAQQTGCQPFQITDDTDTEGLALTCQAETSGGTTTGSVTIRRDATPPRIVGIGGPWRRSELSEADPFEAAPPTLQPGQWTSDDVVVRFVAADAASGLDADDIVDAIVSTEGAGQTARWTFRDRAGNVAVAERKGINIDKTPPQVGFDLVTTPGGTNGWFNTDVVYQVLARDELSGVRVDIGGQAPPVQIVDGLTFVVSGTLVLTGEGPSVTGEVRVADVAGNLAVALSDPVAIDKTPPTIAGQRTPDANLNGWNRGDVTVSFTCSDALSGVADGVCPSSQMVTGEGAGQSRTAAVTDRAGNHATVTVGDINIDRTPPTLTFGSASPAANAAGWHNTAVSVPFATADNLSGVDTTSEASPLPFTVEGAGQTRDVVVTDGAGNSAAFASPAVNIDWTRPAVACSVNPSTLWPANNRLIRVQGNVTVDGGLSGILGQGFVLIGVTSSEPGGGTVRDIQGFDAGSPDTSGSLRATRSGRGTGRVYSLVSRGTDLAGNTAVCTAAVVVPHDQRNR